MICKCPNFASFGQVSELRERYPNAYRYSLLFLSLCKVREDAKKYSIMDRLKGGIGGGGSPVRKFPLVSIVLILIFCFLNRLNYSFSLDKKKLSKIEVVNFIGSGQEGVNTYFYGLLYNIIIIFIFYMFRMVHFALWLGTFAGWFTGPFFKYIVR